MRLLLPLFAFGIMTCGAFAQVDEERIRRLANVFNEISSVYVFQIVGDREERVGAERVCSLVDGAGEDISIIIDQGLKVYFEANISVDVFRKVLRDETEFALFLQFEEDRLRQHGINDVGIANRLQDIYRIRTLMLRDEEALFLTKVVTGETAIKILDGHCQAIRDRERDLIYQERLRAATSIILVAGGSVVVGVNAVAGIGTVGSGAAFSALSIAIGSAMIGSEVGR